MKLIADAGARAGEYRRGLSGCFPGFWDSTTLRWYLPDRESRTLAIDDGGTLVAGTGINYRDLALPDGSSRRAAFLTGAWTLPEQRGRGLFSRLIEAALSHASEAGCDLLASFVTADNASARAALRFGAATVDACYLFSPPPADSGAAPPSLPPARCDAETAQGRLAPAGSGRSVHFHYPTPAHWRRQHLERPQPVRLLRAGNAAGLVEVSDTALRVIRSDDPQWRLAATALDLAHAYRRQFFCYSTRADAPAFARSHGLTVKPGYITLLDAGAAPADAGAAALAGQTWSVEAGDKL